MNVSGFYIVKGDSTCDGRITMEDIVLGQAHVLGIVTLTGDAFTGADVDNNDNISSLDLLIIQKHLLGISMITGLVEK